MNSLGPEQLGIWVLGMVAVVGFLASISGLALTLKKLFEPKPPAEQALTRAEAAQFATRAELQRLAVDVLDVKSSLEKHASYVHTRFHDIANAIAPLPTQIQILMKQVDKIDNRGESIQESLERLHSAKEPK